MSTNSYKSAHITPIRGLKTPTIQTYQTPAKFLYQKQKQKTQSLAYSDEQYYKQKCSRFQKQNKQLQDQIRILSTQNKQMKTQIQIYREQNHYKPNSTIAGQNDKKTSQNISQSAQVQKLLKEIRILKNNHQVQITNYKDLNRKLTKQIAQLQRQLQDKTINAQTNRNNKKDQNEFQQKNVKLQKQLKQMKKSIVEYMEQRDQSYQKVKKLNIEIQSLNKQISQLRYNQNKLLQEKAYLSEKLYQKEDQNQRNDYEHMNHQQNLKNLRHIKIEEQQQMLNSSLKKSNLRDSLYQFGKSRSKIQDKIQQSKLSIHTFNGTKHVPAQQAFQLTQSLNNEILRLQNQIQSRSISHVDQIHNLNYTIQRYQKQLEQKQQDIINLLIKVKPLMLQKHRLTSSNNKQNLNQKKNFRNAEDDKQNIGKNAYGLKMLEIFLKKYKIQTFY